MKFFQAVKMAVKSILAKKGRSFLTMLGIIIGIASVMTIVATVSGYNEKMMEAFEAQGTNKITVSMYLYSGENSFEKIYDYCQGLGEDVVGVTPSAEIGGTVKFGAKSSDTMEWQEQPRVVLGSDQYSLCSSFDVARGRDLCRVDIEDYHQVCVMGARAAKAMFDYADPLYQDIMINGVPFTVVGIYAEKDKDSSYSMDSVIVVPYTASRFLPNADMSWSECVVKVKDSQTISRMLNILQAYIDTLTEQNSRGYGYAYSEQQWMDESNSALTMISVVLGGIAGISLLVGGIGIMNIMLVTVTERTREIGIRRAIGAERSSIVTQFLVEAAMICGIGGIFGIAIGYGGTHLAGKLLFEGMSLYPSPTITLGAFAFSVSLGIIFGMYPAIKASGLQPVVALRAD
ncbi:MAG: FtsX-like permease family protein [Ruminococcaceae bacterium]|nr:FtsX-like permease family protein [Oscillospiraceae bacterium]